PPARAEPPRQPLALVRVDLGVGPQSHDLASQDPSSNSGSKASRRRGPVPARRAPLPSSTLPPLLLTRLAPIMSFRSTCVRLAEHARTPLIRFPDRKAHHAHPPTAHPCAPQSVIDSFPRFQSAQQQAHPQLVNSANSSYGGSPTPGGNPASTGAGGAPQGSGAAQGKGQAIEGELPAWLRRSRPDEAEIDAVMSGGASTTPEVTRAYKQRWYTPQF
ncbi:hypothetical protein DMC30DRAFT_209650, partial [Rhodotorula diobovata]